MAIRADDLQHFRVDDYLKLHEAQPGALERTELVNGVILAVSPESRLHTQAVRHIDGLLNEIYFGRSERNGSVLLSDSSLWDPDVYVLHPRADHSTLAYPSAADVEVAVEVCLNTQSRDLGEKLDAYAANGVKYYWAIMPTAPGWAIVHREPIDGVYHSIERLDLPGGYASLDGDTLERLMFGSA